MGDLRALPGGGRHPVGGERPVAPHGVVQPVVGPVDQSGSARYSATSLVIALQKPRLQIPVRERRPGLDHPAAVGPAVHVVAEEHHERPPMRPRLNFSPHPAPASPSGDQSQPRIADRIDPPPLRHVALIPLRLHRPAPVRQGRGWISIRARADRDYWTSAYSMIFVTTPEPTVLPPSRMAKRSLSSMATGVISSTSIFTLSPGMHISTPAGSVTVPVTSVVRK